MLRLSHLPFRVFSHAFALLLLALSISVYTPCSEAGKRKQKAGAVLQQQGASGRESEGSDEGVVAKPMISLAVKGTTSLEKARLTMPGQNERVVLDFDMSQVKELCLSLSHKPIELVRRIMPGIFRSKGNDDIQFRQIPLTALGPEHELFIKENTDKTLEKVAKIWNAFSQMVALLSTRLSINERLTSYDLSVCLLDLALTINMIVATPSKKVETLQLSHYPSYSLSVSSIFSTFQEIFRKKLKGNTPALERDLAENTLIWLKNEAANAQSSDHSNHDETDEAKEILSGVGTIMTALQFPNWRASESVFFVRAYPETSMRCLRLLLGSVITDIWSSPRITADPLFKLLKYGSVIMPFNTGSRETLTILASLIPILRGEPPLLFPDNTNTVTIGYFARSETEKSVIKMINTAIKRSYTGTVNDTHNKNDGLPDADIFPVTLKPDVSREDETYSEQWITSTVGRKLKSLDTHQTQLSICTQREDCECARCKSHDSFPEPEVMPSDKPWQDRKQQLSTSPPSTDGLKVDFPQVKSNCESLMQDRVGLLRRIHSGIESESKSEGSDEEEVIAKPIASITIKRDIPLDQALLAMPDLTEKRALDFDMAKVKELCLSLSRNPIELVRRINPGIFHSDGNDYIQFRQKPITAPGMALGEHIKENTDKALEKTAKIWNAFSQLVASLSSRLSRNERLTSYDLSVSLLDFALSINMVLVPAFPEREVKTLQSSEYPSYSPAATVQFRNLQEAIRKKLKKNTPVHERDHTEKALKWLKQEALKAQDSCHSSNNETEEAKAIATGVDSLMSLSESTWISADSISCTNTYPEASMRCLRLLLASVITDIWSSPDITADPLFKLLKYGSVMNPFNAGSRDTMIILAALIPILKGNPSLLFPDNIDKLITEYLGNSKTEDSIKNTITTAIKLSYTDITAHTHAQEYEIVHQEDGLPNADEFPLTLKPDVSPEDKNYAEQWITSAVGRKLKSLDTHQIHLSICTRSGDCDCTHCKSHHNLSEPEIIPNDEPQQSSEQQLSVSPPSTNSLKIDFLQVKSVCKSLAQDPVGLLRRIHSGMYTWPPMKLCHCYDGQFNMAESKVNLHKEFTVDQMTRIWHFLMKTIRGISVTADSQLTAHTFSLWLIDLASIINWALTSHPKYGTSYHAVLKELKTDLYPYIPNTINHSFISDNKWRVNSYLLLNRVSSAQLSSAANLTFEWLKNEIQQRYPTAHTHAVPYETIKVLQTVTAIEDNFSDGSTQTSALLKYADIDSSRVIFRLLLERVITDIWEYPDIHVTPIKKLIEYGIILNPFEYKNLETLLTLASLIPVFRGFNPLLFPDNAHEHILRYYGLQWGGAEAEAEAEAGDELEEIVLYAIKASNSHERKISFPSQNEHVLSPAGSTKFPVTLEPDVVFWKNEEAKKHIQKMFDRECNHLNTASVFQSICTNRDCQCLNCTFLGRYRTNKKEQMKDKM